MEDKTIEELKAELDALKKSNLEKELENERKKAEEAEQLEKEKAEEELRNKIREELISEMDVGSKVGSETETLKKDPNTKFEVFSKKAIESIAKETGKKITGRPYDEFISDACDRW